ncbi:glucose-6-phosphate dehydrogenase, partial [Enterococcus faecium]
AVFWDMVFVILNGWDKTQPDFPNYIAGSLGPKAAFELLENDGFEWIWQPDNRYREPGKLNE